MGLLGKIKDLFADEEIDEAPIRKEVIKVEIPAPVKEERVAISDSEIIQAEEKPAPVFFNDRDFEDINIVKEVPKSVKSSYMKPKKEEEKKIFRPSPIISPVYGVLDKNYRKDDITAKTRHDQKIEHKSLSIDDIRKKAFGTLEEDLEQELFSQNTVLFKEELEESKEVDIFEEMEKDVEEEIIPREIFKRERRVEEYEAYDDKEEESFEEETEESENVLINDGSNLEDDLRNIFEENNERIEEDLFNLIDSMYEKEDDK